MPPGGKEERGGLNPGQAKAMAEAIEVLKAQGAVLVDPANIPSTVDPDPAKSIIDWNFCGGAEHVRGKDTGCTIVVKYGMKRDFNKWLATLGPTAPVKTLTELREWNLAHAKEGAIRYGQSRLDISDEVDLEKDLPRYKADSSKDIALTTTSGIDAVMKQHQLDAILFPGSSGSGLGARPGYPSVMVPFALVPNEPTPPFPDGFNAKPQPYGVTFAGTGVQRAEANRPRVLIRAGDEETRSASSDAVGSTKHTKQDEGHEDQEWSSSCVRRRFRGLRVQTT